jgi:hypothetical protein
VAKLLLYTPARRGPGRADFTDNTDFLRLFPCDSVKSVQSAYKESL